MAISPSMLVAAPTTNEVASPNEGDLRVIGSIEPPKAPENQRFG
jgi:hypothetical protein